MTCSKKISDISFESRILLVWWTKSFTVPQDRHVLRENLDLCTLERFAVELQWNYSDMTVI